jgi:hypothetical protein
VVLCELIAGRRLRSEAPKWLTSTADLPERLGGILRQALAPRQTDRYANVELFIQDLSEVLVDLRRPAPLPTVRPLPTYDEERRPNHNPYLVRLIGLFSQTTESNQGTRTLDAFGHWAYVPTRIDEELPRVIADGRYRLVIITGNAGDGKTAFVQVLEHRLRERAGVSGSTGGQGTNGAVIDLPGLRVVTNWDGSQDEGDVDNEDVLSEFFSPFKGSGPGKGVDAEVRVIAINEGRLLDFLTKHRAAYETLEAAVVGHATELGGALPSWLAIVNLNLRTLTVPESHGRQSLVQQILSTFADERLWYPCEGCVAYDLCYARTNAAALRNPVLGPLMAERMRQVLELVRLRRRVHITMRDLRSALAFAVAGHRTCDEIVMLRDESKSMSLLSGNLYNAFFSASEHLPAVIGDDGEVGRVTSGEAARRDRLLVEIGRLDPAAVANPRLDADLWVDGTDAVPPEPADLTRLDRTLLEEIRTRMPSASNELATGRARTDLRVLHSFLRRKLFLEREDPGWWEMLPHRYAPEFVRLLKECAPTDLIILADSISRSEGLYAPPATYRGQVAVRPVAEPGAEGRTFVLHEGQRFTLSPVDRASIARYVEYAPDTVRFQHIHHRDIWLDIDLDLYESLRRMYAGFTPSREELRGAWLNLRLFKERLAAMPSDELVINVSANDFFRIQRVGSDGNVVVEAAT